MTFVLGLHTGSHADDGANPPDGGSVSRSSVSPSIDCRMPQSHIIYGAVDPFSYPVEGPPFPAARHARGASTGRCSASM